MYNGDQTWTTLSSAASGSAETLKESIIHGLDAYNEWQSYRAGRSNATLATALSVPESQVAEMDACFAAMKELHDCASNVATSQSDRLFALRVFA
jgi:hypothetical protein